jgi:uncharacterized membrane protein
MSALNTNDPEAILAAEVEAEIEALEEAEHHPVSALPPVSQAAVTSLTWGFRIGAALLIVGLAVAAIKQESLGARTDPFVEVVPAILDGHARGIVDLAIVTLMATPVVTTLVVAVGFFCEGDRRYGLLTLTVLVVLGISVSLSLVR